MKAIWAKMAIVTVMSAWILSAGTLTYSHTTPTQTVAFTDTFSLPQFNPTLGDILTGITMSLSYNTTGAVDIFNTVDTPQSFTNAQTVTPLALTAPDSLSLSTNALAGPVNGIATAGLVETVVTGLTGSGMLSLPVPTSDWSLFKGSGTFSSTLAGGATSFSVTVPAALYYKGDNSTVGATTTITYDYASLSTVPEPATLALFVSGLLGIGFFVIKRSSLTRRFVTYNNY